jgi:transcriptional regulator with XRE-family HTH domain
MKTAHWIVDGAKLTARRVARGMTWAELARRSGVAPRTLGRYTNVEGALGQLEHLRAVARVLHVPVEAIAHPPSEPPPAVPEASPGAFSPYATPPERARLLAASQLEAIVALEARVPPPRPVPHDGATVPVLTARKFHNVYSGFACYEAERFAMIGKVVKHHGVSSAEASLIGSKPGVAVRFLLSREVTDGVEIKITVHTAQKRETRSLQKAFDEERETCAIVKVVLAGEEAVKEGKGFEFFLSSRPLAWGFVVEAVV